MMTSLVNSWDRNHTRNLQTSEALQKTKRKDNSLFTSAVSVTQI